MLFSARKRSVEPQNHNQPDDLEQRFAGLELGRSFRGGLHQYAMHGITETDTLEREEQLQQVINRLNRSETYERPPIMAIWASMGAGKTHFLDHVCKSILESTDHSDVVVLHMCWGSTTPFHFSENIDKSIAQRMLYS